MQLEQLELTGGGTLTLYLRESVEAMPHFRQRPLVLVVPGGGYTHVTGHRPCAAARRTVEYFAG